MIGLGMGVGTVSDIMARYIPQIPHPGHEDRLPGRALVLLSLVSMVGSHLIKCDGAGDGGRVHHHYGCCGRGPVHCSGGQAG